MGAAVAAAVLLSVVMMVPLRGAIIFTDVPDVNLMAGGFGGEASYDVDFNGDGTFELNIYSRYGDFSTLSAYPTRVAGIPNTPPDSSGYAHPFPLGGIVGPTLPAARSWFSGYGNLLGCADIGCIGLWNTGGTNYVGVEFQLGAGTHYGWIAIEMPFSNFAGGHLISYAYESQPNTPIVAGAIPEPTTAMLVGTGAALIWRRNVKTGKEKSRFGHITRLP